MRYDTFLIKYAEIATKGQNRHFFEDALVSQICRALKPVEGRFTVTKQQGRIYVHAEGEYDYEEALDALTRVFGIAAICPVLILDDEGFDRLSEAVISYLDETCPDKNITFKVVARRARKNYPKTSAEINADLGEAILAAFPQICVDVHQPDLYLNVEIREKIYVYSQSVPGAGGMPVGTAGRAMLLLSGGIDSPVAGYMIARRGVVLDAVYFHAPPYTSERARQKVTDLAHEVARYSGPIRLNIVNFTEIQMHIYETCPHEELTVLMRRYMMRIAEAIAKESGCLGLVTGESIGQVASQTMQCLTATNEVCDMPVYRPLIAFDKQDIIRISESIGTYETSILPYEDCCTIFVARHPVTKPNLNIIHRSESRLGSEMDEMIRTALDTREILTIE